jgi:hypothetical protein
MCFVHIVDFVRQTGRISGNCQVGLVDCQEQTLICGHFFMLALHLQLSQ